MNGTTVSGDRRPLRQDAVRNRERLVIAARETFRRAGLDAPLDEIARQAGVSVGTLYNRFSSRGELIDAALGPVVERSVEIAEEAMRADDPWNGFVAFIEGTCELLAAERGYTDVYRARLSDTPVIDAARERRGALKARIMTRAKAAGVLRDDVGTSDIVLTFWAIAAIIESTRETAPDAWRRHLALIFDGLRADAAHPLPATALTMGQLRNATPPPR
ncbi:MAG: TetR/AcrR family transcriptional regulator [Catenulispora sp.]